ncbi:MAG: hypothetical protein PVH17_08900 [Anaerolineae bacterium]
MMRVKRWLDQRRVPCGEIDTSRNPEGPHYVGDLIDGCQSAPSILFGGVHVATEASIIKLV